jgi:hypothetical protein
VTSSVRSHYGSKEIQSIFQLQPRAAQLLLEMLPATSIGRSRLVERHALADFLDRVHKADDPSAELDLIRARGEKSHARSYAPWFDVTLNHCNLILCPQI